MRTLTHLALFSALFLFTLCGGTSATELLGQQFSPPADQCEIHWRDAHPPSMAPDAVLAEEVRNFQVLAEQALALRAITIKTGRELHVKAEQGDALTGQDLALLSQGIKEHLALREKLLVTATAHECWLDFSAEQLRSQRLDTERQLKGVSLSLAAALVLYDNYLLSISLFEGDSKLRRLLNEGDPGYAVNKEALAQVTLSYNSISNRQRVRNGIYFYERALEQNPQVFANDAGAAYLASLIEQSPSYSMVKKWSPLYILGRKLGFLSAVTVDTVAELERGGVSLFSMLFGNTVGLVETRQGKLYHRRELEKELQRTLKSGDILLEKTPFRLTDKLIPGYWGHAAVWIGSEQELKQLGIWSHPVVSRHWDDEIRNGQLVVEALRSGVEMNRLEKFLNIDSIGVLRQPDLTNEQRRQAILLALRQVGKPYDFNFDVESNRSVYCSKLIYISYDSIDWPVKRSLGRTTFTPDDIASRAIGDGELDLVYFYHDGQRVKRQPRALMAALLQEG